MSKKRVTILILLAALFAIAGCLAFIQDKSSDSNVQDKEHTGVQNSSQEHAQNHSQGSPQNPSEGKDLRKILRKKNQY